MLNPTEAKSMFRKNLLLLLAVILWPFAAGIIFIISYAVNFKSFALLGLGFFAIQLVLLIWLIVSLWKSAFDAEVTPWAFLWIFLPFFGPFIIGMLFLEPLKYKADNLPAGKRLPLTWGLIKETWAFTYKNYQPLIKTSVWFLYLFLIYGASTVLSSVWLPYSIIHFFVFWVVIGFMIYFSIKLFLEVMAIETGKNLNNKEGELVKKLYGPSLWVIFLAFVVAMLPFFVIMVLGLVLIVSQISSLIQGTSEELGALFMLAAQNGPVAIILGLLTMLLFFAAWIWAVYKFNLYGFVLPALYMDDKHGMEALKESERIVKNRWWGLFWKNQLWNIVLQGAMMVLVLAVTIILVIILLVFRSTSYQLPLTQFLSNALNGVIYMFTMPLITAFLIKLYKGFSKSAK